MKSALFLLCVPVLMLSGCGSAAPPCVTSFSLGVSAVNSSGAAKTTGSADHTMPAPGNQQQFNATSAPSVVSGTCAVPALVSLVRPQWTTSDAIDSSISSANDATNGLATCMGTTLTPATITATLTSGGVTRTATTTLTCF